MSDYPEHDELTAVAAEIQAVGEFIEWLSTKRIFLLDLHGKVVPPTGITALQAERVGIDVRKIEAEKRAMLAARRAMAKAAR